MDWDNVNVALDQEAFRAAQEAGNSNISFPWWVVMIIVSAVFAFVAFKVVKSKSEEGKEGAKSGGKK